jgi:hypothetical protein
MTMILRIAVSVAMGVGAFGVGPAPAEAKQRCRLEQQCHWENFKKICKWVTVCREVD